MRKLICAAITMSGASLLSACATTESNDNWVSKDEKQYVTGSNLPKKDRSSVTVISKEALEDAQRSAPAGGAPTTGQ